MIVFGSILTTFESSSIFGGCWGSFENWIEPKKLKLFHPHFLKEFYASLATQLTNTFIQQQALFKLTHYQAQKLFQLVLDRSNRS